MADVTDPGLPSEEQRKKRRLRASTETVRERVQRLDNNANTTVQADGTPAASKGNAVSAFGQGFLWPLRQIARPFRWLGKYKVFRVIGLILFPRYFRNSWRELRLVTWPSRRQSWKLTYAVIVFSVIFGVIIAGVDYGLDKLFKELIIK